MPIAKTSAVLAVHSVSVSVDVVEIEIENGWWCVCAVFAVTPTSLFTPAPAISKLSSH
jgi:hypothetical protein